MQSNEWERVSDSPRDPARAAASARVVPLRVLRRLAPRVPTRGPAGAPVTWTVKLVCPDCRNVVAKQRGVTEAERARAEGPRPVLVCGSRRCGAGVSKDERTWASRPGNRRNPADAWKDTRVGP